MHSSVLSVGNKYTWVSHRGHRDTGFDNFLKVVKSYRNPTFNSHRKSLCSLCIPLCSLWETNAGFDNFLKVVKSHLRETNAQ